MVVSCPPCLVKEHMKIWIDGSTTEVCWVLQDGTVFVDQLESKVTGNKGEYLALAHALTWALDNCFPELEVFSDSELLVKQINGQYNCENSSLQFTKEVIEQVIRINFVKVSLTWIPREQNLAGIELERRAKAWKKKNI
jgi:ribonuclease HI